MCLAIPAKVIEKSDDGMLKATVGNGPTCLTVSGILLPEEVEIGDYIIIHAGFAMHKMEKTEAEESLRLFRELAQPPGRKRPSDVKNVGENSGYKEYPCAPSPNRYAGRAHFLSF